MSIWRSTSSNNTSMPLTSPDEQHVQHLDDSVLRHIRTASLSIDCLVFPQIVYAAVDCTRAQNHELCKQEGVEGYPTFVHYNYGKFVEKYNGDREEAGFIGFMRSLRGRDQEKVVKKKEEL
ncbi:protein disulfide-isomerase A5-like [Anarrhichthys ocellatus]|uniref:protein disulfide-isomerase A5-like n=1 Tax=Anarrhichthys ocellatus TaxID=433405 RepID=UPI0012EE789A|nr:protein disulfide-isomerase A5-like [Anarrhichthys ocellatus]